LDDWGIDSRVIFRINFRNVVGKVFNLGQVLNVVKDFDVKMFMRKDCEELSLRGKFEKREFSFFKLVLIGRVLLCWLSKGGCYLG